MFGPGRFVPSQFNRNFPELDMNCPLENCCTSVILTTHLTCRVAGGFLSFEG